MAETLAAVHPRRSAPPRRGSVVSKLGFVTALVALAVALAVGCGVGASAPPTVAQRAAAIEAVVKCPSCDDLSVAESEASTAIAVRDEITRLVSKGESATQVENALVAKYGSGILLSPPDSGLSSLVWLLPAVGGAGALGVIGLLFWRRSAAMRLLREQAR